MMSDLDRKCKYARFAGKICNIALRSCSLAVIQTIEFLCLSYAMVPTYNAIYMVYCRTECSDGRTRCVAATARNNDDNATQNGNYHISFDICIRVVCAS